MTSQLKNFSKVMVLSLCVSVVGCASNQSSAVYQRNQVGRVQTVEFGTVIDVKPVTVAGTETGIGSIGGAAIGGIAASTIGEGRGSEIAGIVGGIAGLVVGTKAEEAATRRSALEITIEKSNGSIISVVQPDDVPIATGSRVKLLTQPNGSIRVSP